MFQCRANVFVSLLMLLPLCVLGQYATIVVSSKGENKENCITGQVKTCKTLDYALQQVSLLPLETSDVTLIVEYSHLIDSVNISYSFHLNVTVLGVGQPSISCSDNGFLHFSGQEQISVTISFDGISFSGCNGYWDDQTREWITGYAFFNFDTVSFRKVGITQSSDMFFERNEHLLIDSCWFQDNKFHYALVYLSLIEHQQNVSTFNRQVSNNTILNSQFLGNIGLSNIIETPLATVGGSLIPNNKSQMVFLLHVSECNFQANYINGTNTTHSQVSEIGVLVSGGRLEVLNVTLQNSSFIDHRDTAMISSSKMVWILCLNLPELNSFSAHISSNIFLNNSLTTSGKLVSVYLSSVLSQTSMLINYTYNNVTNNEGIGLDIYMNTIIRNPVRVFIEYCAFKKNYGVRTISIQCSDCPSDKKTAVFVSNTEIIENSVPLTENGVTMISDAVLFLTNTSFNGNTGTALYIKNTMMNVLGDVNFISNAGKYGGGLAMYGI